MAGASALAVLLATPALAAPAGGGSDSTINLISDPAKNASIFTFDYGPTASPALGLLGLSPSKVTLSNGLKPFVLSIPGLLTSSTGGSGGIDVSPAWAMQGSHPIYIDAYKRRSTGDAGFAWQSWYRARLEFALTSGASSTDVTKIQQSGLALGASTSLLASSDPIVAGGSATGETYYQRCVAFESKDIAAANDVIVKKFGGDNRDIHRLVGQIQLIASGHITADNIDSVEETLNKVIALAPKDTVAAKALAALSAPGGPPPDLSAILTKDAVDQVEKELKATTPDITPTATAEYDQRSIGPHAGDCVTFAAARAASGADLTAGVGYVDAGKPGSLSRFHNGGETGWLAFRVPLKSSLTDFDAELSKTDETPATFFKKLEDATKNASNVMLGGSIRYTHDASLVTGNSTTPVMSANVLDAWLGLQANWPVFQGSVEGGYTDNKAASAANSALSTSGFRWLVSAKANVFSYWIGVSYGTAHGSTSKLNDKTLLVTLDLTMPKVSSIFAGPPAGGQ